MHISTTAFGMMSSPAAPPSISRQKAVIAENAEILDYETKRAILQLIMMEVGPKTQDDASCSAHPVILENTARQVVSVNLDNIDNPEVILHLYNMVSNRRAALNKPARGADQ